MALPAGEGGGNVEGIVTEIKGLVSGLLFKVATHTKDAADQLAAVRLRTTQSVKYLGDLVAKAELDLDREADEDAEKEEVEVTPVDGDKEDGPLGEGDDGEVVEILKEIRDATKETAEHTQTLADAEKEKSEEVLDDTGGGGIPSTTPPGEGQTGKPESKKSKGLMGALAVILGGVIGTIAGIFSGWFKALKFVFNRGFIKTLSTTFANFFKGLKTQFKGGKLAKGFAKIGKFFKSIGSFFGRVFKIFGTIFGFFKNVVTVAGKVAAVVSKIFYPLLLLLGLFETIKGFITGFMETEGSLFDKILGGLQGAITGLLDFLIAAPLNLVKNIIGWIAGALGFEGVKEKLNSFDFSFGGIVAKVFDVLKFVSDIAMKIVKFPIALAAGIAGGIAALLPGGLSPKEGFMKGFNAVMGGGDEAKAPNLNEAEPDADKTTEGADKAEADATKDVKSTIDVGVGRDVSENEIYPIKVSGLKDLGAKEDEYTITGKDEDGNYLYKDSKNRTKVLKKDKVVAAIDTAIQNKGAGIVAAEFQEDAAAMLSRQDGSSSGVTLSDRQAELAEKRAGYAGAGQGRFQVNNVGGSTSQSVSNVTTVTRQPDANFKRKIGSGLPQ